MLAQLSTRFFPIVHEINPGAGRIGKSDDRGRFARAGRRKPAAGASTGYRRSPRAQSEKLAPATGLEPVTYWLTANRSTIELRWNPNSGENIAARPRKSSLRSGNWIFRPPFSGRRQPRHRRAKRRDEPAGLFGFQVSEKSLAPFSSLTPFALNRLFSDLRPLLSLPPAPPYQRNPGKLGRRPPDKGIWDGTTALRGNRARNSGLLANG